MKLIFETLSEYLNDTMASVAMYFVEFGFMLLAIALVDVLVRTLLLPIIKVIVLRTKLKWDEVFYNKHVFRSLLHFIPLSIAFNFLPNLFIFHSQGYVWAEKLLFVLLLVVFIQLVFRIVNGFLEISKDDNNYTTIGIRTFGQLIKVISIFIAVIVLIAILFNIGFSEIVTVLGALTAVIILVFRDTILGFVSGVQISTTRMAKVGDWISVDKYNVEGIVKEINLTTVKIEKFDKTLAMVPTYDLISSQIVNNMAMVESETRRVKRSIYFKINSFAFLNENELDAYKKIPVIEEYIAQKRKEIKDYQSSNSAAPKVERKITNIGLYRIYVQKYLENHPLVSQEDTLMVRQLESQPQGLPLEVYCFLDTSEWLTYERIQSDVFDHLLTAAKDFNLEITQTLTE